MIYGRAQIAILSVSVLIFAMGCGSSPSKEGGEPTENVETAPPPPVGSEAAKNPPSAAASAPEPPRPKLEDIPGAYKPLSDAIRAQNDDQIRKTAIQLLGRSPQDAKVLNALGVQAYRKNRFGLAKVYFSKGLIANPNRSEIHNNLGLVHLAEGDEREAFRAFHKAIEINPNDVAAASNLGSLYVMKRDFKKALLPLDVAYQKGARDSKILNNYGIALVANGQADKAKSMYQDAMKSLSNSKEVLTNYAILLIDHLNDNKEGLDVINKLRFLGVSPESRNRINALENKAKMGLK